jgi:general stress protein 26
MENHVEKIHGLLKKFDTAMMVTTGRDWIEHARPMGIAKIEDNCDVWFFSARVSEKVRELEHDRQVLLAFQKDHGIYLSIVGRAQLTTDKAKISELWKEPYRVWFPDGVNDSNLLLIRVNVEEAEYWDNSGLRGIKYIFEAAKAYIKGKQPNVGDPDKHGKVNLK